MLKHKEIFLRRFKHLLKDETDFKDFLDSFEKNYVKTIRINDFSLKDELIKNLEEKGFNLKKVKWLKGNFYFVFKDENNKKYDLGNTLEHFLNLIYVQDVTSALPVELLELEEKKRPKKGFKILDMAAAPGSKSSQLITNYLVNDDTLVLNELDKKRIKILEENIKNLKFTNLILTNQDASKLEFNNLKFDRILLDSPCSDSGIIIKKKNLVKEYNLKTIKKYSQIQKRLIKKAFELLNDDGILIYSTCSLEPEENELIIENFLSEYKNAKLEKIEIKNLNIKKRYFDTLSRDFIIKKKIDKKIIDKTLRIWPQDNLTTGFFVAKIKKLN